MRIIKSLLGALVLAFVLFSLIGCGSSGNNAVSGLPLNTYGNNVPTMAWADIVNLPVGTPLQVALDRAGGVHLHPATILGVYNVVSNMRLLVCKMSEEGMIILEGDSGSPVYYTDQKSRKTYQLVDVALTTSGATPMFMGNYHGDVQAEGPTRSMDKVQQLDQIQWQNQKFHPAAERYEIMANSKVIQMVNAKYGISLSAIDASQLQVPGSTRSEQTIVPGSTVVATECSGYVTGGMGYAVSSMDGDIWHGMAHAGNGNGANNTQVVGAKMIGQTNDAVWGSSKLFSIGLTQISTLTWDGPNGVKMDKSATAVQFPVTVTATIDGNIAKFSPAVSYVTCHGGNSQEQGVTESTMESPIPDMVRITTPGQATGIVVVKYPGMSEVKCNITAPAASATNPSSDIAWETINAVSRGFDQLKKTGMSPEYVTVSLIVSTSSSQQIWVDFVGDDGSRTVPNNGTINLSKQVYHVDAWVPGWNNRTQTIVSGNTDIMTVDPAGQTVTVVGYGPVTLTIGVKNNDTGVVATPLIVNVYGIGDPGGLGLWLPKK